MKFKDVLILTGSKLKVRKLRAVVTIITASVLFGVVIATLVTTKGLFDSLTYSAKTTFGDDVILLVDHFNGGLDTAEVRESAIGLFNESGDPEKQYPIVDPGIINGYAFEPYLDGNNQFAIAAATPLKREKNQSSVDFVSEISSPYGGNTLGFVDTYRVSGGSLSIDKLTLASGTMTGGNPGDQVLVFESDVLAPLIKISEQKDDVIQVLAPLDQAARIADMRVPSYHDKDTSKLKDFVDYVNLAVVGRNFKGTISDGEKKVDISYQIVGIIPPSKYISTIDPYGFNPLQAVFVGSTSSVNGSYFFIVTNPNSSAFKSAYGLDINGSSSKIVTSFDDAENAEVFYKKYSCEDNLDCQGVTVSEFLSNLHQIRSVKSTVEKIVVAFVVVFSIIAVVIMTGTISRVVDDERSSIALYRAVGATTKNILQVFVCYMLTISLLVVACSTVIGFAISGTLTLINSPLITVNTSAIYNIPNISPLIFVGFDLRILLIYLVIIVVGLICVLLVLDKLTSKNIVKDLKK